jgi:3'-phosphoadenosine 5'-phosphosulfate (PAPS) 3'-phosphatase
MTLSQEELEGLRVLAIETAVRAAEFVQSQAGKNFEVGRKEGGRSEASRVVTEVDLESQGLILEALQESTAKGEFGLLTEERPDDQSRHTKDCFWCIDPLDGTLPFIENVAGYSVSIALVARDGEPLLGVIADPLTGTVYHALRGCGAFKGGQRLAMEELPSGPVEGPLTLVMDRSFAKLGDYERVLEKIEAIAARQGLSGLNVMNQGGAAMNACWVIENSPAVYFKFPKREEGGGSLWDFAAAACLFAELGAVASDVQGRPLQLNREGSSFMNEDGIVFASSAALAAEVYALIEQSG